jgi:4-hydroxybenzoyl-CoA reductase alpha subunit
VSGKVDGLDRVTGRAQYVADLRRPGMAHAKFVRSPHAHARILAIDLGPALAIEGVLGAVVGSEIPRRYGVIPVSQDETALAIDKVRYVGEPVACIAAVDEETAHRACAAVRVSYEPLAAVLTIDEALDPASPLIHEGARKPSNTLRRVHQSFGDPDAGFAAAALILEQTYAYPGSTHVALETHGALAEATAPGKFTLYTSTQNPHYVHKDVARVLGIAEADLRVIKPAVGAGYGGKCDPFCSDICAVYLARSLDRPVRIVLEREEVFYAHRGRHPARMKLKMGFAPHGAITAIEFEAWADGGAYASYGVVTAYYLGVFMTLPYRVQNYRFTAHRLYTNKPPCGPKRGHGAIQPRFALEAMIDRAADQLGLDPAAMRRAQCIDPGTETCNGLRVTTVGMQACIDAVVAASGYVDKRGKLPPGRGIGLACSAYMCGALHPVYDDAMPQSAVIAKIDRTGAVTCFTGTADIGQGSNHALAVLVAGELGLRASEIAVVEADSRLTPVDLGSYSSRVTYFAGNAALAAARPLAERLRAAAAVKLGVSAHDVVLSDGHARAGDREISWVDLVVLAEEASGTLVSTGSYAPPKIGSRFRRQSVGPSPAYSFTAQVAEVQVDLETGVVTIDRMWCAHDCGFALDRAVATGQIEGCVYMGVGEALYEEQRYRDGIHGGPSILEYKIPTVHETPPIDVILVETHDPGGPRGAKEVGEGPQLSTVPAIANAIADAVGIALTAPPFTPDRVLRALDRKGRG